MAATTDVVYCYSAEYLEVCNLPFNIKGRALYIHKLLEAYGLFDKLRIERPNYLSSEALRLFHCKDYISCIEKIQQLLTGKDVSDEEDNITDLVELDLEVFGLAYDCMPFSRIKDYVSLVAGASVKCAELLNERKARIAINLYGGWHHAHRDSAAGFCYVNDIVLAILKLKENFSRVLYIDMDIHHGDGVEEAFSMTDKVMTVSFHKLQDGYFPGSGKISDIGHARGKYFTVNVPLKDGINDEQYLHVFSRVMNDVKDTFSPDAIVCQCGGDCLAGDPLGGFNLTNHGLAQNVKFIADWNLPMLILGGGGYNFVNTARAWTFLLATVMQTEIPNDIPDHEFFSDYAPSFDINVSPSIRKSQNTKEYLEETIRIISGNLKNIKIRPPFTRIKNGRNSNMKRERSFISRNKEQSTMDENCNYMMNTKLKDLKDSMACGKRSLLEGAKNELKSTVKKRDCKKIFEFNEDS